MKINVDHVAKLARLGLSEEEKKLFAEQLAAILEYADNLKKLDTENVPPTAHVIPKKNVLREDRAESFPDTEAILENAPEKETRMFRVPKIME